MPFRFNLSHTEALVSCGVVLETDIGVDVEDTHRITSSLEIAENFFSPQEVFDLSRLSEDAQQDRFFDYWTLKESYIKARGMGLSLPLEHFSFDLGRSKNIDISFDQHLKDDPQNWRFWLLRPGPHHKAAVSVNSKGWKKYEILVRKMVPLSEIKPFECPILRQSIV
ncbi:MAG: 4'-phosphopantetheinyl transferase superfamily protein [SAR324 cluster bacterium]|nr:4'-phosphopantetheinyl transferase superfamily protein [SAR324 cluster bacterium]